MNMEEALEILEGQNFTLEIRNLLFEAKPSCWFLISVFSNNSDLLVFPADGV